MATKRRRHLPPFVARMRNQFRAWAMVNGKRLYGRCYDDPQSAYLQALEMRKMATASPGRIQTLQDAMDFTTAHAERTCKPGTVDWYRDQWRAVLKELRGDAPLHRLGAGELREFIARRRKSGVTASTIVHHKRALHRMFVLAVRAGHVTANPVDQVEWPQVEATPMDFLELAELRRIIQHIEGQSQADADLVLLTIYTGLRRSELARLSAADVDLRAGLMWVDGKKRREAVQIARDLMPSLRRLLEASAGSVLVRGGANAVSAVFRKWATKLGDRRFHAHALRHSLATGLLKAGERPEVVQQVMRHKSFAMTSRYTHITSPELKNATARLKLV